MWDGSEKLSVTLPEPESMLFNLGASGVPAGGSPLLSASVGNPVADGYGPCTGTSMATPHISALVGLMRSVNPWVTSTGIGNYLRAAGDMACTPNQNEGYGLPNAATAVQSMVATNPSGLIPLMSMYSATAQNYFYTTVPQMASAAYFGTLKPRVNASTAYSFVGIVPVGFAYVPDGSGIGILTGAQAWVFATYQNPVTGGNLLPLIRMSYKCGDPVLTPNPACTSNPFHADHLLTTNTGNEVSAFIASGYQIDGIEGYVFDGAYPQPVGTERLVRAYNVATDDHAVFPLREQCNMAAVGYTFDVTFLGYVYPVTTAAAPVPYAASLIGVKSRKTHVSGGTFDLSLDVGVPICGAVSVESRTGVLGHQIAFQFDAPIPGPFTATVLDSSGNSLSITNATAFGTEIIVAITGVAENQRAKITLTGSGGVLVGTVSMGFLIGDINGTGSVNSSDVVGVKARSGQLTDSSNFKYDLNTSGAINSSDISAVKARSGLVLPN